MKIIEKDIRTRIFFVAALIEILLLALFLGVSWETNDDQAIAWLIAAGPDAGAIFQHKWLTAVLSLLYQWKPLVNWWLLMSVTAVVLGTGSVSYVAARNIENEWLSWVIITVLIYIIYRTALLTVNFTRTAAVLVMAGYTLITESIIEYRKLHSGRRTVFLLFAGLLFLVWGAAIRSNVAMLGLAFLAVSVAWILFFGWNSKTLDRKKVIFTLGVLAASVLILFLMGTIDQAARTEEEKRYAEYNSARVLVQDYAGYYPAWENASEEYEALGFSETEHYALLGWMDFDTERFNADSFITFSAMRRHGNNIRLYIKETLNKVRANAIAVLTLIMLSGAALVLCLVSGRMTILKALALFGCFFSICLYVDWKGRLISRIIETCVLLLIGGFISAVPMESTAGKGKRIPWLSVIWPVGLLIVCIALLQGKAKGIAVPVYDRKEEKVQLARQEMDGIDATEHVFIAPIGVLKYSSGLFADPWTMSKPGYCKNLFYLGGWNSRSPRNMEKLSRYSIDNPMRALVEDKNVFSIERTRETTGKLQAYLEEHYGGPLTYTRVGKNEEEWIIQFQKNLGSDNVIETAPADEESMDIEFVLDHIKQEESGFLQVAGEIRNKNGKLGNQKLFCIIRANGEEKTYVLYSDVNGDIDNMLSDIDSEMRNAIDTMVFLYEGNGYLKLLELDRSGIKKSLIK